MRTASLGVLVLAACTACGSGASTAARPAPAPSPPSIVVFEGVALVTDLSTVRYTPHYRSCVTHGVTADIRQGTRVEVRNADGLRVAVGTLQAGRLTNSRYGAAGCAFAFNMSNAPGGSRTYVVRIGSRPAVRVPVADVTRIVVRVP